MSKSDFHFEFSGETTYVPPDLVQEVETQLRELAKDQTDLIGAAVTVEELTQEETPHFYRARIVAYMRPEDIAAIEKQDTVENALRGALEAIERQIRQRRDRLGKPWQQKEEIVRMDEIFELEPEEVYDAYAREVAPVTLINLDRTALASQLMLEKGLDEEAAYYAADQILVAAQDRIDAERSFPPDVQQQ
jgi:ribosome-associated translation inhibitor RaiA